MEEPSFNTLQHEDVSSRWVNFSNRNILPPFSIPHQRVPCLGMSITKEQIALFKEAYVAEFEEDISDDDAQVLILQCLQLFEMLAKPLPEDAQVQE